ncbi:DUF2797 domain-containing protein [Salinispirillum marinum]|uniref:DUF2797 domain-containing protein n=2 Tax=Saccharospirillaceae TaxID=255527 RepID=A0ABV8BGS7_9GAMM
MTPDLFGNAGAYSKVGEAGVLDKMPIAVTDDGPQYTLILGEQRIAMNEFIGQRIRLEHSGRIFCQHCGVQTKKSWQGFCYDHFMSLAQADGCIMSPEKCHFEQGTCREPEWGERNCFQTHYVYLANTGQVKVGITRGTQVPTRWLDQGAHQALPIARVRSRYLAGLLEVLFKQHVSDKTHWRTMLKSTDEDIDLAATRDQLFAECTSELQDLQSQYGLQAVQLIQHADIYTVIYPLKDMPEKFSSFNFDKETVVEGTLLGMKGQYLILDTGVINIRRFTGYEASFNVQE